MHISKDNLTKIILEESLKLLVETTDASALTGQDEIMRYLDSTNKKIDVLAKYLGAVLDQLNLMKKSFPGLKNTDLSIPAAGSIATSPATKTIAKRVQK